MLVHRPWGWFFTVYADHNMWIKVLTIKPGARLSLQRHKYRNEMWSPLDRGLTAVIGDESLELVQGMRYYVPTGTKHRLINTTPLVCRVVEYADGHPEEDDIERLDDDYDRT